MGNSKDKPQTDFNWEAQWQQLYLLAEDRYSDLQFYKDDLRFVSSYRHFMGLTLNANLDEMRISKSIISRELGLRCINRKDRLHLKHLAELIDAPYKYDSHQCRTDHEKLEIEIDDFVKNFRKTKKEIFAITEKVMKKEFKRLLP
jgi:hypothetical protein